MTSFTAFKRLDVLRSRFVRKKRFRVEGARAFAASVPRTGWLRMRARRRAAKPPMPRPANRLVLRGRAAFRWLEFSRDVGLSMVPLLRATPAHSGVSRRRSQLCHARAVKARSVTPSHPKNCLTENYACTRDVHENNQRASTAICIHTTPAPTTPYTKPTDSNNKNYLRRTGRQTDKQTNRQTD